MKKKNDEITFKDILGIFIPKMWLILLVAIVFSAIMAIYSINKPKTYTSYSVSSIVKDSETVNTQDFATSDTIIANISYRVKSNEFLVDAKNRIVQTYKDEYGEDLNLTVDHLRAYVTYTPLSNGMYNISATTQDVRLSLAIINAFDDIIPSEILKLGYSAYIKIPYIEPEKAANPNSKGTTKNAAIGFVAGGIISAVCVWIYAALDVSVRDRKKLEECFDIPVLGTIPNTDTNKDKE